MKQSFILLMITFCLSTSAKAISDWELAKDYLLAIKNQSLPERLLSQNETEKKLVQDKFKIAIANTVKSGINLSEADVILAESSYMLGTNNKILLVVYQLNDIQWDDVVLCFEAKTYKITDIGNIENSFMMNKATTGQHYANKENLAMLFDKNAITRTILLEEVKTIVRQADNHEIDKFCLHVLYNGGDIAKRKNRMEACNPANPKDKAYCKDFMDLLSGYIIDADDFYIDYVESEKGRIHLKIVCNQTKNTRQLTFYIINGKLLLDGVY